MTGFRVGPRGAQGLYSVEGDLTTLGKVIGGGMPVGAFGGRSEIMAHLAPEGGVYQAGTLAGNPVAMVAGIETLKILDDENLFLTLQSKAKQLTEGLLDAAVEKNIPLGAIPDDADCAKAAIFLASDYACAITGAALDVNGGEYMAH